MKTIGLHGRGERDVTEPYILAIDQGTTSSRALLFDRHGRRLSTAQAEFPQYYPAPGHVEHDPEDIWRDTLAAARAAIVRADVEAKL